MPSDLPGDTTGNAAVAATAPVHLHDCSPERGCRFLGTIPLPVEYLPLGHPAGVPAPPIDLWVHTYGERAAYPHSLIFRQSSEPEDYQSVPYGDPERRWAGLDGDPVWSQIPDRMDQPIS
jgi:hypothetical protein